METVIILVFVFGYLAITLEHSIKIDKLIPALVMMAICWALIALGIDNFPQWFDSANHNVIGRILDCLVMMKNASDGRNFTYII